MSKEPIFYQMFEHESSTYTYLLADVDSKEAILIDPVIETIDRDLKLVSELGLKLLYILDTHVHADHITSAGAIRDKVKAKTCVSKYSGVKCADILLEEGSKITFGKHIVQVLETPGHTDSCLTFKIGNKLFTGDALLIRGNGRTDFQQGSADKLYDSIHKIFNLGDELTVYPAHDYKGQTKTTVGLEKKYNPRIGQGKSKAEFIEIMRNLKLANPKKIMEAVPANMVCGFKQEARTLDFEVNNNVPEIKPNEVYKNLDTITNKVRLIDVRSKEEFNGELGHIKGSELITLGPDLTAFLQNGDKSEEIVFICRSGARSGTATEESIKLGYKFSANMIGGMILWNENHFPVERR